MNLAAARAITTGYMHDDELSWLAEAASRHHRIVEVGSWTGRSTRALADNTPGHVYAVDTWEGSADGDLRDILVRHGSRWAADEFLRNMTGTTNVIPIPLPSAQAAVSLATFGPFDMIFIDACHEYHSVRADILSWLPLLAPDGLLCGHDYTHKDHTGVRRAVDEILGAEVATMTPADAEHSIWWLRKICPPQT